MSNVFDHRTIEKKWQERWEHDGIYNVSARDESKEKEYVLVEWPYPSGNLHIGHWHAFAVPDIYVRFKRMLGTQVLFPMGFDAFGLPAENAAIKHDTDPREWTESNIEKMRTQLKSMGNAFSWDHTTSSTDLDYYKWTQWMFTKFFENDIAYKGTGIVNWCPSCSTVLANEQVTSDDTCERCGHTVEKREMDEWKMRITNYADRLIDDLDTLDWPEHIKEAQRNWIGRSEGAELSFEITSEKLKVKSKTNVLLLHGTGGSSKDNWQPWLEAELQEQGYNVINPDLSNAMEPKLEEWLAQIEKLLVNWNDDLVIIGHSLGCNLALHLASKHSVKKLILVAPPHPDNQNWDEVRKIFGDTTGTALENFVTTPVNYDAVRKNTEQSVAFYSDDDPYVSLETKTLYETQGINGKVLSGFGHFNESANVTRLPELLQEINSYAKVFTTRPDTLFGATYLVLAPEHSLVADAIQNSKFKIQNSAEVAQYVQTAGNKSEQDRLNESKEKTGVKLEGISAINPANGEEIPVFIADYVLASYGTGAIMAVPAHDERDYAFAQKFDLSTTNVVEPSFETKELQEGTVYTGTGTLINSGEFNGMDSEVAKTAITEKVGGTMTSTYRLRDWSVGRQRYWGVPIPIVYDPDGTPHAIPEEHLPWQLPDDVDVTPTGESPLAKSVELRERTERIFGEGWTPEVETMDTFVDSSWYFLRYLDPENDNEAVANERQDEWMPVDLYFGGAEHTTMHLLYSRFWQKALFDLGITTTSEPYTRRINRGLVLGPDGNKMSKSKGNVIDPDEHVERLGADTVKMYLAFMGPYGEVANYPWDMGGIAGIRRFLERVYGLPDHITDTEPEAVTRQLHKTIQKIRDDIPQYKFNTAISGMMEFVNLAEKEGIAPDSFSCFIRVLAPFAPHLAEELWERHGGTGSVHVAAFPKADPELVTDSEVTIGVQVDGKMRGSITIAADASEEEALAAARGEHTIARHLDGTDIKKVIYVPNRILNLITSQK